MSNLLEQAKIAVQRQNWSLVNYYLKQFILESRSDKATSTFPKNNADLDEVIDLGIEVLQNGDFQERAGWCGSVQCSRGIVGGAAAFPFASQRRGYDRAPVQGRVPALPERHGQAGQPVWRWRENGRGAEVFVLE